jgi:hypothetical protein
VNRNRTTLKAALAVALILCVVGLASQASALDQTSDEYLGSYTPPEPASAEDEVGYINDLISVALNTTDTIDGVTYDRSGNLCDGGACPEAVEAGAFKSGDDPDNTGIDVTGFTYLIGKYDGPNGGGVVFYVAGLTSVDLPANLFGDGNSQYGLSHYSLYNPGTTTVPEPGTLLLVGSGLVALGIWRRRR